MVRKPSSRQTQEREKDEHRKKRRYVVSLFSLFALN
jgi:hypothetical protein